MKESYFLNRRVNIIISLLQGIPTFAFAIFAILTDVSNTRVGMIILSVAGSLFCLILEYHSSSRFLTEWKRTIESNPEAIKSRPEGISRIILILHNLLFWSFLIPFVTPMTWRTGFIMFTAILFIRFLGVSFINIRNMNAQQYYRYPFRIP